MTASTTTTASQSLVNIDSSQSTTASTTSTTSSQRQSVNTPASSQDTNPPSSSQNTNNAPHRPFTPHINTKMTAQSISPPISAAASTSTPSSTSSPNQVLAHGTKRTASGTVKSTTPPFSQNIHAQPYHHSRNISVDSVASNISDLSSQLKTRLSYALVKVQNGWEQRSIEEVEALTNPAARRSRDLSHALTHSTNNTNNNYNYTWTSPSTSSGSPPKLAPPAELIPSAYKSSSSTATAMASGRRRPAALTTNNLTPSSSRTHTMTPTPQEQDAVDSLLFMSSPANHTHAGFNSVGPSTQSSSPSRTVFFPPRAPIRQHAKRLSIATEQDVERLLDSIHARSRAEEDEEAEELIVMSPRSSNAHSTPREVHV